MFLWLDDVTLVKNNNNKKKKLKGGVDGFSFELIVKMSGWCHTNEMKSN